MPKETMRDRLERFIENDFHHMALEVANLKGQLKILLIVVGVIAAATVDKCIAIVIQGTITS